MKYLVLISGLVVSLGLAGCGSSSSDDGDGGLDGGDTASDTDTDVDSETDTGDGSDGTESETVTDSETDTDTVTDSASETTTESFACLAVEPGAVSTLVAGTFSVVGTGFLDGLTVTLTETTSAAVVDLGAADVADLHGASIDVTAGQVAAGTYDVKLTSAAAVAVDCPDPIAFLAQQPPTVTDVAPPSAWTGLDTDSVMSDETVVVTGTGFEETPQIFWVSVDDPADRFPANLVLFGSDTHADAVCPADSADMPAGFYHVELTNPSGLGAWWMDGTDRGEFEITAVAPPKITSISPFRSPAASAVVVTIDGEIPEVRPGFTCTADITTATRTGVVAIPIQATTVRELVYDDKGNVVKEPEADKKRRRPAAAADRTQELKPGQTVPVTLVIEGPGGKRESVEIKAPVKALAASSDPKKH